MTYDQILDDLRTTKARVQRLEAMLQGVADAANFEATFKAEVAKAYAEDKDDGPLPSAFVRGENWWTVFDYLHAVWPGDIPEDIDDFISLTQRDGFKLSHWCKAEGVVPFKVDAPAEFAAVGITELNTYPESMLKRRFG